MGEAVRAGVARGALAGLVALAALALPAPAHAGDEVAAAGPAVEAPPAPGTVAPDVAASVRVSGEINLAMVRVRASGGAPASSVLRLDSTNSRLVFRGREPLAAGWEAGFLLSSGLRADAGGGTVCGRECTVALSGPWARVKLGRQLDVYDDVSLAWYYQDAAGDHNPLALWANCGSGAGLPEGCVDNYIPGSVRVDTTAWHGLGGSGFLARPLPAPSHAFIAATGLQWQSGEAYAGLAFQRQVDVRGPGLAESGITASVALTEGRWYVALAAEHLAYDTPAGILARDYGGLLVKRSVAGDAGTIWVNLGVAGPGEGTAPDGTAVNAVRIGPGTGARMWTVGYAHRLSPATRVYAFFNELDDQRAGTYAFDAQLAAVHAWRRQDALALGMSHRF